MERDWLRSNAATIVRVVAATVVVLAAGALLRAVEPDLVTAQRGTSYADVDGVAEGAWLDFLFMAAYFAFGWTLLSLIREPRRRDKRAGRHLHPAAMAALVALTVGTLADVVENAFLLTAIYSEGSDDLPVYLGWMRGAGLVKSALLVAAALTFMTLVLFKAWRPRREPNAPTHRPERADWDPPLTGERVGVSLSGGGIRSAAFCLGALQALRASGKLAGARYLTAVSGGGYLAAGWAISDAAAAAAGVTPPPWAPGSPEERWFRDHSSYLVPDTKGGVAGLFRLLAGLAVNIALLGVLLATVARPIGWLIHEIHPNLQGDQAQALVRDGEATMRIGEVTPLGTVDNGEQNAAAARYAVSIAPADGSDACFDLWPYETDEDKRRDACVGVVQDPTAPGIVEVSGGRVTVVRAPKVKVDVPATVRAGPPPATGCDERCASVRTVKVEARVAGDRHVPLRVVDDFAVDGQAPVASQFEIGRQPQVTVRTGLGAMTWPAYKPWMWQVTLGLLAGALVIAILVMATRPRSSPAAAGRALASMLAVSGLVVGAVVIALPWVVIWLPRTLQSIANAGTKSASGSAWTDYLVPNVGVLALVFAAARQFLAGSEDRPTAGTGPSKPWYRRAWGLLTKRSAELKWYESSPSKLLLAIVSVVAAFVAFVNPLQFAVANGVTGRLMGFGFARDHLPYWMFVPDWAKFGIATAGLALFAWRVDAHSWSMYPFYKARLSSAYVLRRDRAQPTARAEPIPYETLVKFTDQKGPEPGPQLVACCAVNLGEYGRVPPGRRAASFTFSSTEIGGPLVGYATPDEYEALPYSRARDLTVPSAMAISGAAFSPAMGKFNLGPIGAVLALANLRLGVWIPNPSRRDDLARSAWWWTFRRPHWVWFLRELTNKYALDRRYLYVSDGGHWDNLGLVELLRRGCTTVYCMSGAGDGALSFGTIGEAIALAREELGVEIVLDPSPLRARVNGPDDPPPDERVLRREGSKDAASPLAGAAATQGTFTYPNGRTGRIFYAEANLTAAMPFDVHTFAEAETVFPDDSTGDQVFNHRQFESYRALGYYQAEAAVGLANDLPPSAP